MMFCPNCGSQLSEGSLFCGNCGARQMAHGQPVSQTVYSEPPVKPRKKKKKGCPVILVLVLVLVLAAAAVFVLTARQTVYLLESTETVTYLSGRESYSTLELEYDKDGNLICYTTTSEMTGEYGYQNDTGINYEYDEDGRIVAAEIESALGSLELEYVYDKKGILKEVTGEGDYGELEADCTSNGLIESISIWNVDGLETHTVSYEYDSDGNLEEKTSKVGFSEYVFAYENGKCVDSISRYRDEQITRNSYEFDEKGNTTQIDTYSYDELIYSMMMQYDKDDYLSEFVITVEVPNEDEIIEVEIEGEVERDDEVVTITLTGESPEGEEIPDDTYIELEYDDHGNWIRMEFFIADEPYMEYTRSFAEVKVPRGYEEPNTTDPIFFVGVFG